MSVRRRNKKHSRTSPDVQFKDFSLKKQKLDLKRTMSELGKSVLKNEIKNRKKTENQYQNAAYEQKKPLARSINWVQTKNRPTMNYE